MAFTIQPAVGKGFINREEELQDILTTLKDRESTIGFALMGKRRMGKTSIFKETERLLKGEKNIFTFSEIFRELRAKVTNVARFLGYLEEKAVVNYVTNADGFYLPDFCTEVENS